MIMIIKFYLINYIWVILLPILLIFFAPIFLPCAMIILFIIFMSLIFSGLYNKYLIIKKY